MHFGFKGSLGISGVDGMGGGVLLLKAPEIATSRKVDITENRNLSCLIQNQRIL